MTENPLISIITPVLNGIAYLDQSIQSVLNQSYPCIEHIFIDGGSTDGTVDMLLIYQSRYPARIRFISEPGKNACEAWNKGWEVAKGDIFGFLGADDLLEPDAILTVVEFFKPHPDAYFVYGGCNYIDKNNKVIRKYPVRDFNLDEVINHDCYIPAMSAFYRRELVQRVGSMDTTIHLCDRDYWIKVGKIFRIYRIDPVLSSFRWHEGSLSSSSRGQRIYAREYLIISQRHGARFLSLYRMIYYGTLLVEFLRPVMGPIYPFLYPLVIWVAYPFVRRVVFPFLMWVSHSFRR